MLNQTFLPKVRNYFARNSVSIRDVSFYDDNHRLVITAVVANRNLNLWELLNRLVEREDVEVVSLYVLSSQMAFNPLIRVEFRYSPRQKVVEEITSLSTSGDKDETAKDEAPSKSSTSKSRKRKRKKSKKEE